MSNAKTEKDVFTQKKDVFLSKLDSFGVLLDEAKGKAVSPELEEAFGKTIQKVEGLKKDIKAGKLKIALVGAFSDGKTSTVAGFIGHSDPSMKIAEEESSDEIVCYFPENIDADVPPCEFDDTPGLFGKKFSQKTKDYVSQAHVVLYIVNATNLLKESHKETVFWLMNTLQKFDNAIFVINRMDEVCDYTDSENFDEQQKIKISDLRKNVSQYCGIDPSDERIRSLNVVCISSDPGGKGLMDDGKGNVNYWLTPEHREKYELHSRMQDLRRAVSDVVGNTLSDTLMRNVALVAVKEEVRVNCELLQNELQQLEEAVLPEILKMVNTLEEDLKTAQEDLRREIRPCRRELETLEKGVCGKIRDATLESFAAVIEDEIGAGEDCGYKIQGKIQDILAEHFGRIVTQTWEKMSSDIELGESNVSAAMDSVKKGAATIGSLAKGVDKAVIFGARELLGKIGIVIKFKPWQATKLANFASKTVPVIGATVSLVADIGSMIAQNIQAQKLAKAKSDLVRSLQEMFKGIYDDLNDEAKFYKNLTPQILELGQQVENARRQQVYLENASQDWTEMKRRLSAFWTSDGDVVTKADAAPTKKTFFSWFARKKDHG